MSDVFDQSPSKTIPYLTQQLHCNPVDFPQFENVYITSYANPFIMVYEEGQFRRQPKNEVIKELIGQGVILLGHHIEEVELDADFDTDDTEHGIFAKYKKYNNSVTDEDDPKRKELEKELIAILLDQGDRLKMDPKSKIILKNYLTDETTQAPQ